MLECGQRLISLARQFSFWLLRTDRIYQAKFRVPRLTQKTHAFENVIRPALHVQGAWCEGFGFHFAVADADMKKDTNNNIEVLARLMEQLYCTWDALPLSIAIIQDNTARECNTQKNVMWAVRLVAMGVFESIVLCYPPEGSHPWAVGWGLRADVRQVVLGRVRGRHGRREHPRQLPKIIGARHTLQERSSTL